MKKKKIIIYTYKKILIFIFFLSLFLVFPFTALAEGTAHIGFSSSASNVYKGGSTVTVTMFINSISGTDKSGVQSIGGYLNYDNSYLTLVSSSSGSFGTCSISGTKIGCFGSGVNEKAIKDGNFDGNVMTFVFSTTSKIGSTIVSLNVDKVTDGTGSVAVSASGVGINIINPPSTNNNLSSLSINGYNLNNAFNAATTSYKLTVPSNVNSVIVNASVEDTKSSISGTGSQNLAYGNNNLVVTVRAESGAIKKYTITVIRTDDRSTNNKLSSLKVSSGTLSPEFNSNVTSYSLTIPYEVADLNVTAVVSDAKSKYTVSGNTGLVSEETKNVNVTVTAENGSTKTYVISVTRGKDPNKVLSTNNYLTTITPNIGILSPIFDKEKTDYEIWLPYEVTSISFVTAVEDTKYASIQTDGSTDLEVGSNKIKFIVTAEDLSTKTYVVNVRRAQNPTSSTSSNVKLKSLVIKNGKLLNNFDSGINTYKYTKTGSVSVEAVADDENATVKIITDSDNIYILVEAPNGEIGVYSLELDKFDIKLVGIIAGTVATSFVMGFAINKIKLPIKGNKKIKVKKSKKGIIEEEKEG